MNEIQEWIDKRENHERKPHPQRHRLFLSNPWFKYGDLVVSDRYIEFHYNIAYACLCKLVSIVRKQYPKRITYNDDNSLPPKRYKLPRPLPRNQELWRELMHMEMKSRKLRIAYFAWKRQWAEKEEARLRREISWVQDN